LGDTGRDVLIAAIGNPAASRLLLLPALLPSIDAPRRARLVKAVARHWQPAYTILVLARLRAPELLASVLDQKVWAYEAKVREFLAIERFVTETDTRVLAAVISARASSDSERAAALDRCRSTGRASRASCDISTSPRTSGGTDSRRHAAAATHSLSRRLSYTNRI